MDFNSNDEYLKAFPPNFGPKLDFQVQKALPKKQQDNIEETYMKQMPEPACLYEELECVELQEPTQVPIPVHNAENKDEKMLSTHELLTLCEEDLAPGRENSNSAQPEIIEPMPQVMKVQRDNEMVLGESDGEPSVETAPPLQTIETRVFDGETLVSDTPVEGTPSAIEIMQETTIHCEIPAEDVITIGVIKDSIFALDNISGDCEAEKSVLEEAIEVATMKDETTGLPPLREFVEGAQIFVEQERPITDIDTAEGNTMGTEPWQDVQNEQPAGGTTLGQIEFVEETMTTLIETSESADAIAPIETKEPVTLEMIKTTTTIRATYETRTSPNELTEHTQIESEVLGTEDATVAVEITEKTTVKAKTICPYEFEDEPPCARNDGVPSASNSTTGLEDLGTCSDADVDKIVDSIMNDIADIEADMEVENEADMENNSQYQKLEICGKSVGKESSATVCQDYIQSTGSHV